MSLKYFTVFFLNIFKVPLTMGLDKHYFLVRLKSVLKRDEWWDDVVCNFKKVVFAAVWKCCVSNAAGSYLSSTFHRTVA